MFPKRILSISGLPPLFLKRIESECLRNTHKSLFKLVYKFGKFKPYSRIYININMNIHYALELELSR